MSTDRRTLLDQRSKALWVLENQALPRELRAAAKKAVDTASALLVLQDAEKLQNDKPLPEAPPAPSPTDPPPELAAQEPSKPAGLLH